MLCDIFKISLQNCFTDKKETHSKVDFENGVCKLLTINSLSKREREREREEATIRPFRDSNNFSLVYSLYYGG